MRDHATYLLTFLTYLYSTRPPHPSSMLCRPQNRPTIRPTAPARKLNRSMLAAKRRYGRKVYRQSTGSAISSYKVSPGVNIYYLLCPKVLPGVTNMLPGVTNMLPGVTRCDQL